MSTVLVAGREGSTWRLADLGGDRLGLSDEALQSLAAVVGESVLGSGEIVRFDDLASLPATWAAGTHWPSHVRSAVGAPLIGRDGDVLGVFVGFDPRPGALDDARIASFERLARLVANDLEREVTLALLCENERKLTDFFDHAPMPLHWVGKDGTILRANQAELDLLGYRREEYVGHKISEFHADAHVIEDILARLGANETLHDHEARLRHKDGSIRDVLIDSSVHWQDGEFVHTRCFTRDITQQKAAQQELVVRACQQAAVADLGQRALSAIEIPALLDDAVAVVAGTFEVEYATVLELLPDGRALIRAGVGWPSELIGTRTVETGAGSQAGYTIHEDEPVVLVDFRTETRFSESPLMREHGIVSGLTTVIHGRGRPFGVLGAHSSRKRVFTDDDVSFVRSVANVLAASIERSRVEEALRETRFRKLIEHAQDLVSVVEADGEIRYASPATETILGIPPADLVGAHREDLLHPDDRERNRSHFAAVVARPGPHPPVELRLRHRDGTWRWIDLRMTNWLDVPSIAGIVVNGRDITERKDAELRVQRSEANLAQAQRMVHLGSWELDAATNEVVWSDESYRIFGLEPGGEPLTEERFVTLVHPDDEGRLRDAVEATLADGGSREVEYRIVPPGGAERLVHGLGEAVRDATGAVVGLRGTIHDVTEERRTAAALHQKEARFRSLVQSSSDLITVETVDGELLYESPSCERLLGYTASERVGRNSLDLVHADDRAAVRDAVDRILAQPERPVTVEIRLRHRDGAYRYFEATLTNLLADPNVSGIVANARDVTERKVAEATRDRLVSILDATPDLVGLATPDGRCEYLNPAGRRLLGVGEQEDVAGRGIAGWYAPWARQRLVEDGIPTASRDGVWHGESALLDAEGQEVPTSQVILAHRGLDGTLEFLSTVIRDTTETKRAEKARQLALAAWSRSFDALPDHLCILDRAGTILQANKTMRDRFEPIHGDLVGLDYRICYCGTTEPDPQPPCAAVLVGGPAVSTEMRLATMPGWYNVSSYPIDIAGERQGAISVVRDVTARKEAVDALAYQALHDPLTGLPNRRMFEDRLARALQTPRRPGEGVAVLLLDLDRFKWVVDSLGHLVGDEVIIAVGRRLGIALRRRDTLARFAGDEFVVLLDDVKSQDEAAETAERLIEVLRAPIRVAGHAVFAGASIGVAYHDATATGPDQSDVMRQADAALHRAKATGGGAVATYNREMGAQAIDRQALETDLRRALERGELAPYYQPQVDLDTGRTVGAEALVQWQHPERGLVSPGEFLPLAEETGLISRIDALVLGEACRHAAMWRARPGEPPFRLGVNVSARRLQVVDLADQVTAALDEAGLDPANLELEITESMLVEDSANVLKKFAELRAIGVRLAIDDFGIGYSSLGYLSRMPIDTLKIDRSFVAELEHDARVATIVGAIRQMAEGLAFDTVAEGIETAAQFELLRGLRIRAGQGYYFGKPMSATDFEALLAQELSGAGAG